MNKIYISIIMMAAMLGGLTSCGEDDLDSQSIYDAEEEELDEFDTWLLKNFTMPYNVEVQYKMKDIESDMSYNLVPADSAKSAKLAIIVKYLWFDAYSEVTGTDFVKANVPKVLTLIGSPAYDSDGTMVLGTAEGGYKVTLYLVNYLTDAMLADYETLTAYYFTTMHHEFTHILNQKQPYDTDFDLISESDYVSGDWYAVDDEDAYRLGFVRNYAMAEGTEDFAETLAQYVTLTDEAWQNILDIAGESGAAIINQKLDMVRTYMQDYWDVDLDAVHEAVQHRGQELHTLDLDHLN